MMNFVRHGYWGSVTDSKVFADYLRENVDKNGYTALTALYDIVIMSDEAREREDNRAENLLWRAYERLFNHLWRSFEATWNAALWNANATQEFKMAFFIQHLGGERLPLNFQTKEKI